jgi:hypothetical protein
MALLGAPRRPHRLLELRKEAQRFGPESGPGLCQRDLAARAVEQADPDLDLELRHGLGQRRLRHAEPQGGPPEMQLLRNQAELPKLAQFDL